jgi:hypothetical protein
MNSTREYFLCDECGNRNFRIIYNFSLHFHGVNFSDQLIYDEVEEEFYQCTKCEKHFTKKDIEDGLVVIRKRYRKRPPKSASQ